MAVIAPARDPRLAGYVTITILLSAVGLLVGQPVLLVCAAAFAAVLVRGLSDRGSVDSDVVTRASDLTVLEGDTVTITITAQRRPGVTTHVSLVPSPSWHVEDPMNLHSVAPSDGSPCVLEVDLEPRAWGRLSPGLLRVVHRNSGSLVMWEELITLNADFRVLPPPARVRELLPPPTWHSLHGAHPSTSVGDGFDFAELRPYQAGDRLRDINWHASGRFAEPHVNRRHPEKNGDVVILLDTFTDSSGMHSEALQAVIARAARAAWSIARLHLAANDRVGLAVHGRINRQLPTSGGDRARYALLETLLDVGGMVADGQTNPTYSERVRIPATALVIALTPLTDTRVVGDLLSLRAAGRSLVVVEIDLLELLPPAVDHADQISRRMHAIAVADLRRRLTNDGIPVTTWTSDGSLSHVIGALRHVQRARLVRR